MAKHLILCDCNGSQKIDAKLLGDQCGVSCSRIFTDLCQSQIAEAAREIQSEGAILACLQEQTVFGELADEIDAPEPQFLDLRDRAGWTAEGQDTTPKMAALIGEALLPAPVVKMLDIQSSGRCLILGSEDTAIEAAEQLAEMLSVTVLLPQAPEILSTRRFDVVVGRVKQAAGSLGDFSVKIDALQQVTPGGRGELTMGPARDGGRSECDVILDLSGKTSLFSAHARDGYLRADPRDGVTVAKMILAASQLVGGFEKPF